MKVWIPLYGMVWLVTLEFLTLMLAPRGSAVGTALHVGVGLAVIALAFVNMKNVEGTRAPARTKRVAKAAFGLAAAGGVLGALLLAGVSPSLGLLRGGPVYVLHILAAFAVITQAASIATSFDMWEEREFVDSAEGAAPKPAPSPPPAGGEQAA